MGNALKIPENKKKEAKSTRINKSMTETNTIIRAETHS